MPTRRSHSRGKTKASAEAIARATLSEVTEAALKGVTSWAGWSGAPLKHWTPTLWPAGWNRNIGQGDVRQVGVRPVTVFVCGSNNLPTYGSLVRPGHWSNWGY